MTPTPITKEEKMENVNATLEYLASSKIQARLSDWEKSFTKSLSTQFKNRGELSSRQIDTLGGVYQKHAPSMINAQAKFEKQFKEDGTTQQLWEAVISYYEENPPYYSNVIRETRNNKEFIPHRALYIKMTENTYFQKWLELKNKEPAFDVGDLVRAHGQSPNQIFLKNAYGKLGTRPHIYSHSNWAKAKKEKHMFLIESICKDTWTASMGSKLYKVIDISGDTPYSLYFEERHLKKV